MEISEQVEEAIDYLRKCLEHIGKDDAVEAWYWLQNALRNLREVQTPLNESATQQERAEDERRRKKREAMNNVKKS